jgi:V8-like Glu-specific endopeptidase
MTNTSESGPSSFSPKDLNMNGNIASPKQTLEAAVEWTTEELLAAKPYPIPKVTEKMINEFFEKMTPPSAKGGSTVAGGLPSSTDMTDVKKTETLVGFPYPPPFNQHEVLVPYTTYPYCTVGKVFFNQGKDASGHNLSWVASASSIGNNGIWTAGHVVHSGGGQLPTPMVTGGWSTNLVFVPAYKDGTAPFGQFTAPQLFCRTNWYLHGNPGGFFEDMGGAILNPLNGRKISQVVGWLGFAWNFPRNQNWTSLGYPAEPPFNGQRMWEDTAPYANDGSVAGSPPTIGIGCSMTGGCSGGPWVLGLVSTNYVNGNNSYRPDDQPLEIYSPYFGDNAHSLMQLVTA